MTEDEARECILMHSYRVDSAGTIRADDGFLGMLRPYRGLREQNFHEIMAALAVLGPDMQKKAEIDRELVSSLWSICMLSRAWGLSPEGMLCRNNLISPDDLHRLERWVDIISWAVFFLLDGSGKENAFEEYKRYCTSLGSH